MTLSQVCEILDAKILVSGSMDAEVRTACGSDFMSDVLAFAKEQALLLTGLVNAQVIRTADMMDMKAIAFVRGKTPNEDMIALAKERSIVLFSTSHPMYIACGLLYQAGLRGDT
jgi:DRTGG domain.